ncbi:MAG: hypothetical protein JWO52_3481 [Gammaproteobacteria bacterium]|nr:hypothetical protein [Gammaproteobacteria bacterium]
MTNSWSAERVAALLNKARRTPNGFNACCPAHDDKNPSLFIADGKDGGLAMVCYAGCQYRDIAKALESLGAQVTNRNEGIPEEHFQLGEYHQHWDYRDITGRVTMRICRWQQPGGRKDIRPLVLTDDGWKWQHHPNPRPLFQLDRLAADPEKPVIVVEGEKAAHAAQRLFPDYIATTWPGGAQSVGQADWTPLKGRTLHLIPDCDMPGRKAMAWVREHVKALAGSVRIVDPITKVQGLPEGWDLADALNEDRDVSKWLDVEKVASRLKRLTEILAEPTRPQWLIKDVLEQGIIAILLGPRGTYKSFIALHWAMTIAIEGSPVVVISGEGRGIDRRFKAWLTKHEPHIKPSRVPIYALEQRVNFNDEEATDAICADIDAMEVPPVLIIVDTFSKNSGGLDENSNSEVKAFIGRLDVRLKRRYGATILLIHHTGHSESGRARGASAIEADTDATYVINRSPGTTNVTVSRERFKDSGELPPLAYRAEVIGLGEFDDDGNALTSLALVPVDPQTIATEKRGLAPRGLRQRELLKALRELQSKADSVLVWGPNELRRIARELGMPKQTAQDTCAAVFTYWMVGTICGYRLPEKHRSESPVPDQFGPNGQGAEKPLPVGEGFGPPVSDPFSDPPRITS